MFLVHLASYVGVWVAVYIFFLTAEANPGGERMLGYCVSFAALADILFLDASLPRQQPTAASQYPRCWCWPLTLS